LTGYRILPYRTDHNMGGFFGRVRGVKEASAAFDAYITETVAAGAPEREARVKAWASAPHARDCHPLRAEEHLAPLFVVAGAAYDEERGARIYNDSNAMGSGATLSAWEFRS
jgi:aromatic ring-opening dioxygenase catalytic subunit (LigB family)